MTPRLFGLFSLTVVASCGTLFAAAEAPGPPNIVVVLIDDMGYRDLSCFGGTRVKTPEIDRLTAQLSEVNIALWDIEDGKRDCERRGDFGDRFVQLARSVYVENDRRAAIKRAINEAAGSDIVEEKSYKPYAPLKDA